MGQYLLQSGAGISKRGNFYCKVGQYKETISLAYIGLFLYDKNLNPFKANVPLNPPEDIRKPLIFRCFQGEEILGWRKHWAVNFEHFPVQS